MRTALLGFATASALSGCVGYSNDDVRAASNESRGELLVTALNQCKAQFDVDCIKTDVRRETELQFRRKPSDQSPPNWGIALSGGGSKSAPFALGVLQAFVANGWLDRVDYISSVSGGGYAALYLYASAVRASQTLLPEPPVRSGVAEPNIEAVPNGIAKYFTDVKPYQLPNERRKLIATQGYRFDATLEDAESRDLNLSDEGRACLYSPSKYSPLLGDNAFLSWVDCYQDVLSSDLGGESTIGTYADATWVAAKVLFVNLLAAPAHYVANGIFDWRLRLSPAQHAYIRGVFRTYGFRPSENTQIPVDIFSSDVLTQMTAFRFNVLSQAYAKSAAMNQRIPIWIIEATAGSGNVAIDVSSKPYDLSTSVFEFTAFGYGSGKYGYVEGDPGRLGLTVPDAVLASAAFFDTAQRSFNRFAVNGALTVFNTRWGLDIWNYNVSNNTRRLHALIPWPFYLLSDFSNLKLGPTIHLSDGGQSGDVLGMVPLIRRGVRHIVVASGEVDFHPDAGSKKRSGQSDLGGLCAVNRYLNMSHRHLVFEGHPNEISTEPFDLSNECSMKKDGLIAWVEREQSPPNKPVNPLKWRHLVWRGEIRNSDGMSAPCPTEGCQQVYYLKAGLDRQDWFENSNLLAPWQSKTKLDPMPYCIGSVKIDNTPYDCTVLSYIRAEEIGEYFAWPQTSTVGTTFNSSSGMSRAYRALGRFLAEQLPLPSHIQPSRVIVCESLGSPSSCRLESEDTSSGVPPAWVDGDVAIGH